LVGHNGAGKTTTLRAIAGLLPPSSGQLQVDGYDVMREAIQAKTRWAYMPDDPQLFDALTVGEHLTFIAAAYALGDVRTRAAELLEFFELAEKIDAPAEDLSRGMRQKLAICCGYLHAPAAILFDEPFTGLDPHAIRALKESIRQRCAAGAAVIVSSHLLAMVEDLCTHFLVLADGETTFSGTRGELLERFQHVGGEEASLEEIFFRATALAREATQAAGREAHEATVDV
jgi:ABC-2 type transport system ATP-binding protein